MESHRDPSKKDDEKQTLTNSITDLPEEVWLNILSHLTPTERAAAAPTCQLFNALTNEPPYWEKACKEAGVKIPPNTEPEKFKLLYANHRKEKYIFIHPNHIYYVLGGYLDSSRPLEIQRPKNSWGYTLFGEWKDGFSYKELVDTIPKQTAMIFEKYDDAKVVAFWRRNLKQGKTQIPAIIELTCEKSFLLPKQTEKFLTKKIDWHSPVLPELSELKYATIDLNNPELTGTIYIRQVWINNAGLSTPHYLHGNALEQVANKCLVM